VRTESATVLVAAFMIVPALMLAAPVSGKPSVAAGDTWTVMVYIDADNNLESFGVLNWHWLESVGSSDKVNFVVLLDTYSGPANLMYINKGSSTILEEWGEVNMADPMVMSHFMKEGKKLCPASNYAFISWDHGGGWRGLNWDDTSEEQTGESQYMDMCELGMALADARIDWNVFAFDQCLMAQPEVAYELAGYADYVVFSEETVYGQGFPYDMIAEDLVANPMMDAKQVSCMMVGDFAAYYSSLTWANDWTISAFDMTYMDDITAAVTELADSQMAVLSQYRSAFKNDLSRTQGYYYPYFVDLKGYAMNVMADPAIKDPAVKKAATDVVLALNGGMVLTINSKHNSDSYGMSIYFPSYKSSYLGFKPAYEKVPFAIDTNWLLWIQAFASNK